VSRYAKRVRVTLTAWPEVIWRIRVLDPENRPIAGAVVESLGFLRSRHRVETTTSDGAGWLEIRGLPAIRRQMVRAWIEAGSLDGFASIRLPGRGGPVESEARLTPAAASATARTHVGIGLGGGTRGDGAPPEEPEATAGLTVTVTRRDGSAASHAAIRIRGEDWSRDTWVDAAGRFSADDLRPGAVRVSVREAGILPASEEVVLVAGRTTSVAIREPEGRRVLVTVGTYRGGPARFAAVRVLVPGDGPAWIPLEGDVQHVLLRTDAEGRIVLTDLPAGPVKIRATLGARSDEETVTGGTVELEV
jgi:hypothetical protein